MGRLTSAQEDNGNIKLGATFDGLDNLLSASDAMGTAAPFYNPTSMVYQGGKLQSWTDSAAKSGFTYTYDNDGRLTNAVAAPVTGSAALNSLPQTYTDTSSFISTGVDSLGSLTSARVG